MAKRNFSSKRNAIYNAVCGTDTHPSARWVYDKLKPEIPDLSLGTVYRNIALFKDEGTVRSVLTATQSHTPTLSATNAKQLLMLKTIKMLMTLSHSLPKRDLR